MPKLADILENAKDGVKPSYDDCYYAMLMLHSLLAVEHATVCEIADPKCKLKVELAKKSRDRLIIANNADPKEYLGDNIPGNERYDKVRRATKLIAKRIGLT